LVPYKNQFILVGEAFYPHYTYNSRSAAFSNYSRYMSNPFINNSNNMIFDGYQYTHAIVIGFDQKGKILWDNSFQINDVKSMTLEKYVKVQPGEDNITVHYMFENVLRTKIIKDSQLFEGKTSEPVPVKSWRTRNKPEDMITSTLDNWYKDYFYTYGTQNVKKPRITSKGLVVEESQKVFFINKITYK